jgi:hypothetical protein
MKLLKIDDITINIEYIEGFRVQSENSGSTLYIFMTRNSNKYICHVPESPSIAEEKFIYILTYYFDHRNYVNWECIDYLIEEGVIKYDY